jgi:hypothetical protein
MKLYGPARLDSPEEQSKCSPVKGREPTDKLDGGTSIPAEIVRNGDELVITTRRGYMDRRYKVVFSADDVRRIISTWEAGTPKLPQERIDYMDEMHRRDRRRLGKSET